MNGLLTSFFLLVELISSGDAQTEVIALVIDSIVYMSERRFKLITCVEVKMFTTTG